VRRQVDAVDIGERPGGMGRRRYGGDVRAGAEQVGGTCHRDDLGAPRQLRLDVREVELARLAVELDPAQRRTRLLRRGDPRADVAVVVQPCDDHLVTGGPALGEGARDVVRQLGHRPAEDDTARISTQQVGHGLTGAEHDRVGASFGCGDGGAIRDPGADRFSDRVADDGRHLGPTRSIEVRDVVAESGKRLTGPFEVEGHPGIVPLPRAERSDASGSSVVA
jgi:hypothetical protein